MPNIEVEEHSLYAFRFIERSTHIILLIIQVVSDRLSPQSVEFLNSSPSEIGSSYAACKYDLGSRVVIYLAQGQALKRGLSSPRLDRMCQKVHCRSLFALSEHDASSFNKNSTDPPFAQPAV